MAEIDNNSLDTKARICDSVGSVTQSGEEPSVYILGGIFEDGWVSSVSVGRLGVHPHVDGGWHAGVELDPVEIVAICRRSNESIIKAACIPFAYIEHPPYIHAEIQVCLKTKRVKLGWVIAQDNAEGSVIYQIRLYREELLRRFGLIYLHCHDAEHDIAAERR